MGYKPEMHKNAVSLYGYQGDKRSQKAHIVIPRKQVGSLSNDVGFERKSDGGFTLHASEYDRAWVNGKKIMSLRMGYAENKLKQAISVSSRFNICSREEKKNGQIEIHLRVID